MGKLTLRIVSFFYARKAVFFLFLSAICILLGIGMSRLRINQNIFATLPKGKAFEQFNKLVENNSISNLVVLSLDISKAQPEDDMQQLASEFADSLKPASARYLEHIVATRPDIEENVVNYYYDNFPYLIDSSYYTQINAKIQPDSIHASMKVAYNQLVSPGSSFLKNYILRDPVFISGKFFSNLRTYLNPDDYVVDDGIAYTKDKKHVVIVAHTTFTAGNSKANIELLEILNKFKQRWDASHPAVPMNFFGTFEIAAENAIQVKKDNSLTITLSVIFILLLLNIYYRKIAIPFYFFLPTIFGAAFALGLMGFIKPEISAISLATAAVLLGIIVDYAFHFFTHLKHTRSIDETIKEISMPLFTGSFTTITALAALRFSNSPVLQDFGTIAAIALTAAAVFTLTGLPIILKIFKFDYNNIREEKVIEAKPSFFTRYKGYYMIVVVILTAILLHFSQNVEFDSNLENMSVHSDKLVADEARLTNINPKVEKKIFLFATHKNYDSAALANYHLFEHLVTLKTTGKIKNFLSPAQFVIPASLKATRGKLWENFWETRKGPVVQDIAKEGNALGLTGNAFDGFSDWIGKDRQGKSGDANLLKAIGIDNLIDVKANQTTFISTIIVKNENLAQVKAAIAALPDVEVFDRAEIASSQLDLVKNDFNYLFWITATIVFCTMLVIYGRIELTILAFLPMAISWTWILGIAGLLGIKFNFVNVVISTFVFGLGDDFSIFVTDGLLNKYKHRNTALGSYTSAILLSATATMIGLGVLFFAKHPAIHSIAAISVLGIACILFLSLTFQPILFDFFVFKRIEQQKAPIPLSEFVYSIFEFSYFVIVCLSFYGILAIFYITPISKKQKIKVINKLISAFSWTVIYFDLQVKKRIFGREHLDLSTPKVIIANHTSFLDILLILMLNRKIILMVNRWVYHSPLFGIFIRYAGYIFTETGAEENLDKIKERVADGYSILIFPEGSRSPDDKIQRFHKGAFYLSQELKLDIIPILIHGASYVLPKNDYLVKRGALNLNILPAIRHDDVSWGTTYKERCKSISAHFKAAYITFKNEQETAAYLRQRVLNNYIYKGPVIEWYTGIKYRLEAKNYEHYNTLIRDRKNILDIGCGYGYMDFYLHYKNPARVITAFDYDAEKTDIAANCFDKTDNLCFYEGDAVSIDFGKQDVIFLNDILHYLPATQQTMVLQKSVAALNEGGMIFVRDGITDEAAKHKKTELTEYLSTKIFRFNKKEHEFEFLNKNFIQTFAAQNGLGFEMIQHSEKTSNVLFILKRK